MNIIYLYHLTQNGVPRYVGVTTNITNRKSEHKRTKPPHTFEIIDTFTDKQEAGIAEQYHIAAYGTFFYDGWNKSRGGEKLLTGDKHPKWTGGFDRKAYMKEYNEEYHATPEVKTRRKELDQRPERKAKNKEDCKKYYQKNKERLLEYHRVHNAIPEQKAKKKQRRKELDARPEAITKKKEYDQRPEVKERKKKYGKEYNQRPEVITKRKERQRVYRARNKHQQTPEQKAKKKEYDRVYYQTLRKKQLKQ